MSVLLRILHWYILWQVMVFVIDKMTPVYDMNYFVWDGFSAVLMIIILSNVTVNRLVSLNYMNQLLSLSNESVSWNVARVYCFCVHSVAR